LKDVDWTEWFRFGFVEVIVADDKIEPEPERKYGRMTQTVFPLNWVCAPTVQSHLHIIIHSSITLNFPEDQRWSVIWAHRDQINILTFRGSMI